MTIPETFRHIAADVAATGEAHLTTPRSLIGLWGAQRRGRWWVSEIRSALKEYGLTTDPDFETAYIDGEIQILRVQPAASVGEDVPGEPEPVQSDVLTGGSLTDPVARVRMLEAANRVPISVARDDDVRKAMTIMLLNDFSQLPVMANERDVYGMISWRSIGRARALGRPCARVRECMEPALEISNEAPLLAVITLIAANDAVLVRQRDRKVVGLVTTSDMSLEFRVLAEPFLLLREIENHLRRLVDGRFSRDAVDAAKDPGDTERQIEDVADLTFGEYIRLLQNPDNWAVFEFELDRVRLCDQLDRVRKVRNEVMHFSPDGVSDEDLELLRDMVKFLQQL